METRADVTVGNLTVTNITKYRGFWQGRIHQDPTNAQIRTLRDEYDIKFLEGCYYPMGEAPAGWDEQNQNMKVGKPVAYAVAFMVFMSCAFLAWVLL